MLPPTKAWSDPAFIGAPTKLRYIVLISGLPLTRPTNKDKGQCGQMALTIAVSMQILDRFVCVIWPACPARHLYCRYRGVSCRRRWRRDLRSSLESTRPSRGKVEGRALIFDDNWDGITKYSNNKLISAIIQTVQVNASRYLCGICKTTVGISTCISLLSIRVIIN